MQGVQRLYADEDGWEATCRAMEWIDAPVDKPTPFYYSPATRRCFFILHLFAGRRRDTDYHAELQRLSAPESFDVKVLSFDTAIDARLGDLSASSQSWSHIASLARNGHIAGALAGPPCETFTEARNYVPEEVPESERHRWPRPLRDEAMPWGLESLTCREMRQMKVGSCFALQVLWIFAVLLVQGGHMLVEHPAPPKDPSRVSIFRLAITTLLLKAPETSLRVVLQRDWGAKAVKPTGFLTLRTPKFWPSMRRWISPCTETTPAIGRAADGTYRTAALKEYPPALSKGLAQSTLDALKDRIRSGAIADFDAEKLPGDLWKWCQEVEGIGRAHV